MIIWGGWSNAGGIYDPATDAWTATSQANAPSGRISHTAVSTGSKMIVWGGNAGDPFHTNTGGVYDAGTDAWTATSLTNAPFSRVFHTALWTGSRMIIWGGMTDFGGALRTGGLYDPGTDVWSTTNSSTAPEARYYHTAVWTGSKMIVWGGAVRMPTYDLALNSGGIYDPATDTWTPTSMTNAPSRRYWHTAVWTGSKMIVWGGDNEIHGANAGALYDPATDTWTPMSMTNAPTARIFHTAVWTGSRMIVWGRDNTGGLDDRGGIYDPATDTWTRTSTANAPSGRIRHTSVWTGSKMIVWGGTLRDDTDTNTGGMYTPAGIPLVAGADRKFPVVGTCGVPAGVAALSVNLAVTQPTAAGNLRLYPAGTPLPLISSVNYSANQTRANNAIVRPNANGELAVRCSQASGTAHLIIDVNGYFDSSGSFYTLSPCRSVDTRSQ